jgi:arginyl-tRNA synthetase
MKDFIRQKIAGALAALAAENGWPTDVAGAGFALEEPANPDFGHLAANAAMILDKKTKLKPRDLAAMIVGQIDDPEGHIEAMEIAGPGFVNFRLSKSFWAGKLSEIRAAGADYGRRPPTGEKILVEFVSANPTGPLHVGHGRGAALGDALARIMSFLGHAVEKEYYINDAGRQMKILGESVLTRLRELQGLEAAIPADFYKGDYIADLAEKFRPRLPEGFEALDRAEQIKILGRWAAEEMLKGIKDDLADFRVTFDVWFSERALYDDGLVDGCLDWLRDKGFLYDEGGALWFKSVPLGDDKDRVLIKSDGEKTYFASDIAYHKNKFDRGFDRLVDVWGADHHGYIQRLKASIEALGRRQDDLSVVLVQLVNLIRDGQGVNMSTRAGQFVTLREVLDEVGADAARFIFLTRSHESSLDFDLDLAKSQSRDNPVFYVQYVCARISSLRAKAPFLDKIAADPTLLIEPDELEIIKHLNGFPETLLAVERRLEPHQLVVYLTSLAKLFHQYYGARRLIDEDNQALSAARLELAAAVRQVAALGLSLLGVDAPDKM